MGGDAILHHPGNPTLIDFLCPFTGEGYLQDQSSTTFTV